MKTIQIYCCCFWAILYCLLNLVTASGDELADFYFTDLKEIEWNYDGKGNGKYTQNDVKQNTMQPLITFDDFEEENQVRPFNLRVNVLKRALSKALTNTSLRQKFVEVMPILRVLSSQQRLALSALISAQINTKENQMLKIEQVRTMFGDNKELLLPIVFDIANLVRNSASKYLDFTFDISTSKPLQNKSAESRMDDVALVEFYENDHPKNADSFSIREPLEKDLLSTANFFSDSGEEMLDPQIINEELQRVKNKTLTVKKSVLSSNQSSTRRRRALTTPEFVHKLIRSVPPSTNDGIDSHLMSGKEVKLNTSGFLSSKDLNGDYLVTINKTTRAEEKKEKNISGDLIQQQPLHYDVEDDVLANLNGTALHLQRATDPQGHDFDEPLPQPEELISGPRYRMSSNKIHRSRPKHISTKRKRTEVSRIRPKGTFRHNAIDGIGNGVLPHKKCERFTSSMCIRTEDYPLEQIMGSIRRHKNAMTALWADYHNKFDQLDTTDISDDFSIRRREDETSGNGMCKSIVRYARPQKARAASGEWKYIVNTGQHTQTLRLEKCSTPQESCSYLSKTYHSHCAQIYNYHRLLSWDHMRGLHVDIFKVPTCCSCQLVGFPPKLPFLIDTKSRDFNPTSNSDAYSTINEELDYNDNQDEDDLSYQVNNGLRKTHKKQDIALINNQLTPSGHISKTKHHTTKPTLGSYLSPPDDEEVHSLFDYANQHHPSPSLSTSIKKQIKDATRRQTLKDPGHDHIFNEARADLDFSPSELHQEQEVKFSGGLFATPNKRVPQKRQRIHSVIHTALASTSTISTEVGGAFASVISNSPMAARVKPHSATTSTRRVVENRGGIPTNANQAPSTDSSYHSTVQNKTNFSSNGGVYRNRQFLNILGRNEVLHRLTAPTTSATAETPGSTQTQMTSNKNEWSVYQTQEPTSEKSSKIPLYHVNTIDSTENNTILIDEVVPSIRMSFSPGAKRINYSYHPIIDFFENHKYSTTAIAIKEIDDHKKNTYSQRQIYPKSQSQSIRFGVNTRNDETKPLLKDRSGEFRKDENIWHPVIVN